MQLPALHKRQSVTLWYLLPSLSGWLNMIFYWKQQQWSLFTECNWSFSCSPLAWCAVHADGLRPQRHILKFLLTRQSYSKLGLEPAAQSAILDELLMRMRLQKIGSSWNLSQGTKGFRTSLHLAKNTSSGVNETSSAVSCIHISGQLLWCLYNRTKLHKWEDFIKICRLKYFLISQIIWFFFNRRDTKCRRAFSV